MATNPHAWYVIMAGGAGTRFWPISTQDMPKQLIEVGETGETFIQHTAHRLEGIIPPERTIVVTNRKYAAAIRKSLPFIPSQNILEEPYNRDTAPCVALASYTILKRDPDAVMVVVPSDHLILETEKFRSLVADLLNEDIVQRDALVTIGITATRPDTNYGYIQVDGDIEEGRPAKVKTFTEKPDFELASAFVQSGEFLWNSGIFIWRADTIKGELERYLPQLMAQFNGWEGALDTADAPDFLDTAYSDITKISIDYAVMQRTGKAWVYPAGIGWYDIGTWESLYSFFPAKDRYGNASNCKVMACDSRSNLLLDACSEKTDKLIAVKGLDGYVVVNTDKVLLICQREDKEFRKFLSNLAMPEFEKYR